MGFQGLVAVVSFHPSQNHGKRIATVQVVCPALTADCKLVAHGCSIQRLPIGVWRKWKTQETTSTVLKWAFGIWTKAPCRVQCPTTSIYLSTNGRKGTLINYHAFLSEKVRQHLPLSVQIRHFLPNVGECILAKEPPKKTLSVVIRQQRDCDSRWVADSVIKVIVVYDSYIGI